MPGTSPRPRTALVTGASSGIGAAVAAALAARGLRVYGTSRAPAPVAAPVPGGRVPAARPGRPRVGGGVRAGRR